jgi:sigma-B regulation protein RsbU (phosphoserine phosphatase)
MLNKSIAYRLSIYISIAVVSVFIAFIVIAFYFNSGIIKDSIVNKATALGAKVMMIGEKQLVSTREIASNISEQAIYYAQHDDVGILVETLLKKYSFLNAIHVNIDSAVPNIDYHNYYCFKGEESILFQKSNELIYRCKHEEKIFENVVSNGTPAWTESFICNRNTKHVISYYSPIRVQGVNNELVTVGSVIVELSLLQLNDSIKNLKIGGKGQFGYAAIISKDGTYLTHPNKDYILKRNLYSLPNSVSKMDSLNVSKILNSGLSGTTIAYPEYLNSKKSWVYYTPIKETGWTLMFVIPYNDLFVPLYLLVLRMLFFSVLGILIIFFIVTYISNKLILPLSNVTTQLKKFSSFSGEYKLNTRNEIDLVSESLDFLKSWYEKFEIEHRQEELLNLQRTADLNEASEIQMSLINTDFSIFSNRSDIDIFTIYKPARIVSGDLFDFILLDNDNLFFTIGDVSGKGLSAAFFMSVAQTLLKKNSKLKVTTKIVETTNDELFTVNQHQFFLTLFCGVLNLKTGVLKYCNSAHTPALILNVRGELTELEPSHGLPLGLYPNRAYNESSIKLKPGDSIVLYSDGVTEQQNNTNEYFGNERFYDVLTTSANLSPKILVEEISETLDLFKGEMKQTDDITIMVLEYKNKKRPD